VKAANNDGIWNENPTSLQITVLPPFWRSHTAFVLYAMATLCALLLARWLVLYNERINFQIQKERETAHRLHELDMIKIKFFTNVSHEFRTPLTLILTPLEKMLRNASEGDQKKQIQLIHRNARRLLNLVNQLLDFRRMEVQEIRLNTSEGDIIRFIRDVFYSFSDLSEKNNIQFSFETAVPQLETLFDQDKLEKILFNLLSNAFKFTPENGAVSVRLDTRQHGETSFLEIKVEDTGIGIALDKQERIFERFFQDDLPTSMVNQGSGIGLSITREFVRIHGGTIRVESEPGAGSCFTVLLPVTELKYARGGEALEPARITTGLQKSEKPALYHPQKKPVLLLVEDNEDFRFYLKDNLKLQYVIKEARNGKEGLETALTAMPDLIVSDIMMPEMNGIELCRKLKADSRTSHIPVVMLTARSADEQKIEGFAAGANDYVSKPFNFEILQSRIKNLIAQRDVLQKNVHRHIDVKTADVQITSLDEKLIAKAVQIVEANIGEADFSVEKFSRELGMSRVHLYKKLLSLTGKSPIEFIRTIRLQRAAQLLEKSQLSVSEIAYQVGFNNPKYFSKYFKDEFNMLPSAYAHGNK
jgi:signal transduction histidine kinase/DNA-binding response OmpR family regulator